MSSINKVILIGNCGKDAESTFTPSGLQIAKFSIATSESFKKGEEWEEKTEWHNITMFGKSAEYVADKIKKGYQVYVEGKISTSSWEDESGCKKYRTDIIASICRILNKNEKSSTPADSNNEKTPF